MEHFLLKVDYTSCEKKDLVNSSYSVDTGVLIIDDPRCMGAETRQKLEHQIMDHDITYRLDWL